MTTMKDRTQSCCRESGKPPARHAFTLIELLAVIGIIGVLAALLVGAIVSATSGAKSKRVRTELDQLVTAIEDYKSRFGFYPPDNSLRPDRPPLFYELSGTYTNANQFWTLDGQAAITPAQISSAFNRAPTESGFANAARTVKEGRSFLPNLKPKQYSTNPNGADPGVYFLNVPVPGTDLAYPTFNPWRYVSSSPTNNPKRFDLWAEIVIGDETNIIGNWKN
jgi:prepilin-type N-terminal cleavage/methylation domain-containing protein